MKIKRTILLMLISVMFAECMAVTNIVEAKVFTKTGEYYTGLCTKDDKDNQYDSYAKKLKYKKTKFTLYGTMHYTKPGDAYASKIYKKAKRTYKLASNCKFYMSKIGEYEKKKISYKKLKKLSLPLAKGANQNRALNWVIKKGKVVEIEYRSN